MVKVGELIEYLQTYDLRAEIILNGKEAQAADFIEMISYTETQLPPVMFIDCIKEK